MKREHDARLLGIEGLLTTYVQGGEWAFAHAARVSGVVARPS